MDIWYTLDDLSRVATQLLTTYGNQRIYTLEGELGTGKTTLVAELCRQLKVSEPVSSPTFSIVNEYRTAAGGTIHHLDCYRLESVEEAIEAGLEELLATAPATTADAVFVEWPAVIEPLLPDRVVFLSLYHDPDGGGRRRLSINTGHPPS
ncbi:tRNA threonylcarbamoyladenosine biosynthesis protein TsaE [Lewinella aquimaris]|uniref:tRNA threonylcarbamoyladenosine biosynthesis protein TsaE n=1 Tax=Neolewinella aquimaris TaxID=1835722 RepID=A0A840EAU0_9BACT|nr:tRNA (adenosine(37)-N6)-threonylcarbamoyltransferase complex ATPase subunit type 1 TsaE [Neolewinella aquimaris]MBB4079128.1 tRNA threonylcarbamoyladenosine biosynthesis protein TsaE [Neolewinella aquimaris]